jgi:putative aminopeptidase FrvX
MDNKLLLNLFFIASQSREERPMREFLAKYLTSINIPFSEDSCGNIYNISNENKPLLSAHMDTVQDDYDILMRKYINIQNGIIKGYGIIGGDDKCGIYSILDLLKNGHDDVNFLFTVEEESGGVGSSTFVNNNDLDHILYGLILDRRGSGDIICYNNNYGVKEFETVLSKMGSSFGYAPSTGTFSDADFISAQLSCANLSVGYYNAHSKNEYVVLSELQNSINFTHSIIKNLDMKFDIPPASHRFANAYSTTAWANDMSEYLYPYESEKPCELCGSTDGKQTHIKTLQAYICQYCIDDLKAELIGTEYPYDYDLDGFESSDMRTG